MLIQTIAAGGGPRRIFDRDLMAGHYDAPGLTFEGDGDHDYPVAEVRKDVGEALIERYPGVEAAEENGHDAATATTAAGAEGDTDGQPFDLESLPNVGPATAGTLVDVGYGTPEALREADTDAVAGTVTGLSESDVAEIQAALAGGAGGGSA